MASFFALAASAAAVLPILQSRSQHCEEIQRALRHRESERLQLSHHHATRLTTSEMLLQRENEHTIEQDMQRYRVRLAISRRQSARDAANQRFLWNQTLLVVTGLLVGCVFTVVGQGVMPFPVVDASTNNSTAAIASAEAPVALYGHAGSCGLAILALMSALWCCLKVQARVAFFDHQWTPVASSAHENTIYTCGRSHATFSDYFQCHAESLRWWSEVLLHVGALSVMASGWCFAALTMFSEDVTSRSLLLACMGVGVVFVFGVEFVLAERTTTGAVGDYGGLHHDVEMERRLEEQMRRR